MNRELYTLAIPANAQTLTRSEIRRNLAKHGLLDESTAAVESLSLEPGQQVFRGQFRGKYARLMAKEVEELFDAANITSIPFYDPDQDAPEDGYYSLENIDIEPADPNLTEIQDFDGVLTKEGTRESKRRAVRTNDYQPENDFGNEQSAYVGVPTAAASDVQWYNPETEQTEPVSVVETRTAEHGSVDVVDAQASSFSDPSLVFDLDYRDEGKVDTVLWDDHDREKLDADGINAWQWVFSTAHEFSGSPVVDNGLVRVRFDGGIGVEEWDDASSTWTDVALGTSDWSLSGWDVTRISPTRTAVQCRFVNAEHSKSPYHLDMSVKRGYQWPQWTVPDGGTPPTPSGLQDLLSPVANGQDYSPQMVQGLVSRTEVRR